ncbi:GHKL domain-containing protein [Lactobacillus johnsonii]|uniref:GHKL domain-containing protein n=1 Tax=Lactobacillus johnsonii TaxID=33959 RepID=A0AAW5M1P1_LACJH|nr:GHKL domain-containing protein [Lactobacillus johnsonii]
MEIMIYSTEETLEYEIQNKKRNLAISTKKIQQKGFSTKKEHSGLGLSTIRKITETYENMSITYDISNDYFDFYLVMDREV